MSDYIAKVFEEIQPGFVVDEALFKRLREYNTSFVNKNEDHSDFFGGCLTGVHIVRFNKSDEEKWFNEIVEIDESDLNAKLLATPVVNEDHNVASDPMNHTCIWLAHMISKSHLSEEKKKEGMAICFLVLQYKFLTSRLFRHFQFPANRATAEATYAALSKRFMLKKLGSWMAVLKERADDIVTGIHSKTIRDFKPDAAILYILSDTQTRTRKMLLEIYDVFINVHRQGTRIVTTEATFVHEGEEMLRDMDKKALSYERYLTSILSDDKSFIREELVVIIEKTMPTMSPRLFRDTLLWISKNYQQKGTGLIDEVIQETIIHSLDYFNHHRDVIRKTNDLPLILTKLRGVYTSSRNEESNLLQLREKCEKLVKQATNIKSDALISSVRTGLLLYFVLRALTMNAYM